MEIESKKMFFRSTVHEIRTPITTMVLGLNLLEKEILEGCLKPDEANVIIKDISDSCQVAFDLVSDLLTHDKIKEGTLVLEREPVKLWNIISSTSKPFILQV